LKRAVLAFLLAAFAFSSLRAAGQDEAWIKYGLGYLDKNQYEKSIIAFEKALYANPDNYLAYEYAGNAYLALKDKESALNYYQKAYDINPSPRLKKMADDLYEQVFGLARLAFYPLTFEAFIFGNLPLLIGSDVGMSMYSFSLGGGAFVTYHLNSWLALKSGVLYTPKSGYFLSPGGSGTDFSAAYLDIPAAIKFKFRLPWAVEVLEGFSIGGYFGAKVAGRFSNPLNFNSSEMPGADTGLYFNLDSYYFMGPVAFVTNQILEYSLVDIYPNIDARTLNLIISVGAAF
jgi:tetratricopeptide (TPR) repeat protein